mmetsp:Transcript_21707/g.54804  ORF Transcript_21707/g.54804 Transcript_21707/m.54804 type:complete len:200 (+) Transcript_21707:246-845(+)
MPAMAPWTILLPSPTYRSFWVEAAVKMASKKCICGGTAPLGSLLLMHLPLLASFCNTGKVSAAFSTRIQFSTVFGPLPSLCPLSPPPPPPSHRCIALAGWLRGGSARGSGGATPRAPFGRAKAEFVFRTVCPPTKPGLPAPSRWARRGREVGGGHHDDVKACPPPFGRKGRAHAAASPHDALPFGHLSHPAVQDALPQG